MLSENCNPSPRSLVLLVTAWHPSELSSISELYYSVDGVMTNKTQ